MLTEGIQIHHGKNITWINHVWYNTVLAFHVGAERRRKVTVIPPPLKPGSDSPVHFDIRNISQIYTDK